MLNLGHISDEEIRRQSHQAKLATGEADISRRSLLAFLKGHKGAEEVPATVFFEYSTKLYVALIQRSHVAGIYRVRNDLQLKRMRRIPEPVAFAAEEYRRKNK